ncbi:MAG: histidine kinase N-terminal 7TM domain-containing protein [Halorientalis sp.]
MSGHELLYHGLLAVGGLLSAGIGGYAWRRRDRREAWPLVGLSAAVVYWIVTTSLVIAFAGTPLGKAFAQAQYVGITLSVFFVFLLALRYTGREEYVTPSTVAFLLVHPVLTNVAVWVPPLRGAFLTFGAPDPGTFYGYAYQFGPLFLVHTLYSYVLLTAATVLYVSFAVRSEAIYQRQTVGLIVGLAAPWVGNALYLSGVVSVDITSLAFAVTGLAIGWAIFYQDFLEIVPVARSTVVDNIDAGVVVLDRDERIVDVNPRARDLLELDEESVIGDDVTDLLDGTPVLRTAYDDLAAGGGTGETEVGDGGRDFHVRVSPLRDRRETPIGRLLVIEDISERKRRQRELERQNERLEQFASVLSHDLRNPLNVAASRLELGLETGDRDHFEQAQEAHERMDRIIDDVLTLAREGRGVTDTETVSLAEIATEAWRTVATAEATLTVETDRALVADPDRLRRAFENLFRNSVEHAGPDVTVTVGEIDRPDATGFYVADDGPGIPADQQDAVFEDGFTTADGGTGFGLSIVRSIVEAHGWEIGVTDSEAGGARFEITEIPPLADRDRAGRRDERTEAR